MRSLHLAAITGIMTAAAALGGCSLKPDTGVRLEIDLREHAGVRESRIGHGLLLDRPGGFETAALPTQVAAFDCYAVNVYGAGIYGHYGPYSEFDFNSPLKCRYPGVTSAILPAGQSTLVAELTVPSGPKRVVQVIGIYNNGVACPYSTLEEMMWNWDPARRVLQLGHSVADLYDDTTLEIANEYDPLKAIEAFDGCGPRYVNQIATGEAHTCILAEGYARYDAAGDPQRPGSVYCFGNNTYGQLGDGTNTSRLQPVLVTRSDGQPLDSVVSLGSGYNHTCAVSRDFVTNMDTLYCWGKNDFGQLGDGTTTHRARAVVSNTSSAAMTFGPIAGGANHTCYDAAGTIMCMGRDDMGQVGDNTASGTTCTGIPCVLNETPVSGASGGAYLVAGENHTCMQQSTNLSCWGSNLAGQLGDGTLTDRDLSTPVTTGFTGDIRMYAAGGNATCMTTEEDPDVDPNTYNSNFRLYCWGDNGQGQLGDGTLTNKSAPGAESLLTTDMVGQLDLGHDHGCFSTGNSVHCWGRNNFGQVGNGTASNVLSPALISSTGFAPYGTWALSAGGGAGSGHTCAYADSRLYCWGSNTSGQHGNGGTSGSSVPRDTGVSISF